MKNIIKISIFSSTRRDFCFKKDESDKDSSYVDNSYFKDEGGDSFLFIFSNEQKIINFAQSHFFHLLNYLINIFKILNKFYIF